MNEWALSGARLLQFASTLTLFGSTLFFLYGFERQGSEDPTVVSVSRWLRTLLIVMGSIGVVSAAAWIEAEAVALTGSAAAWRDVVGGTRLGQILVVRAGLLLLCLAASLLVRRARTRYCAVSVLGALCVLSFVWTGHGTLGSGAPSAWHAAADCLHLLMAGIWLGALLFLALLVMQLRRADGAHVRPIALAMARFSSIGPGVVGVLVLTGVVNTGYLVGWEHWTLLLSTSYGALLGAKIVLLSGMLAAAAINRFQLTPRLQAAPCASVSLEAVVRRLRLSLAVENLLALMVLVAVAWLGTLEPPVVAG